MEFKSLNGCIDCNGALYIDSDKGGEYIACFQCGLDQNNLHSKRRILDLRPPPSEYLLILATIENSEKPPTLKALSDQTGLEIEVTKQHLKLLENVGYVTKKRKDNEKKGRILGYQNSNQVINVTKDIVEWYNHSGENQDSETQSGVSIDDFVDRNGLLTSAGTEFMEESIDSEKYVAMRIFLGLVYGYGATEEQPQPKESGRGRTSKYN
jgi:predicted transcriptional regulator